ncbi:MAG: hypothetical protein Q9187_000553 [Circinaria calcarea]
MSDGVLHVQDSRTAKRYEIPIHHNSIRATSFKDIKAPVLCSHAADKPQGGLRIYDPGLQNTAVVESEITYIDGTKGIVQYRGHRIEELFQTSEYEDLLHLFVWGNLPSSEEKANLRQNLAVATQNVPPSVIETIRSFPRDAAPVPMIIAGLSAYLVTDPTSIPSVMGRNLYHGIPKAVDSAIIRTLGLYSVVIGLVASHRAGKPFRSADPRGGFLENLLLMMGLVDPHTGRPDPKHVAAVQHTWVLSAEHGSTNSTSAMLLTASTLADPISCLIGALASGYGPLHFGATEVAYKVMAQVGHPDNVPQLIDRVKAGEERLFGYGHRMYKTVDPRVDFAKEVLEELKAENPLLAVAVEIDRIASTDEYFISRHLNANADLYGVFIYIALYATPFKFAIILSPSRHPRRVKHNTST